MNLDALTEELARDFDPRTWDRGARYAGEGRVRDLTVSPGAREVTMTGTVRGTRSYRVIVTLFEDRDGIGVEGDCECPVGWNCKHAVAVLLEAVEPVERVDAISAEEPDDLQDLQGLQDLRDLELVEELRCQPEPVSEASAPTSVVAEQRPLGWLFREA